MMSTPAQQTSTEAPPSTSNTSQQLSKAQKKILRTLEQRIKDRKRINVANIALMNGQMRCSESTMFSPPEKKQCNITVAYGDMKPFFSVGEYVKVVADTSSGMNRLEGFGWISSVRGVRAATLSDVQYDKAYDNGQTHKNIPVKHLTPIVFGADFHQPRAERVVEVVEEEEEFE